MIYTYVLNMRMYVDIIYISIIVLGVAGKNSESPAILAQFSRGMCYVADFSEFLQACVYDARVQVEGMQVCVHIHFYVMRYILYMYCYMLYVYVISYMVCAGGGDAGDMYMCT
jgi:hypothetical protein